MDIVSVELLSVLVAQQRYLLQELAQNMQDTTDRVQQTVCTNC